MPKLNGSGPLGKGPKTGRSLGKCSKDNESIRFLLGKGLGLKKKDGCGEGLGRRLKYNESLSKNNIN